MSPLAGKKFANFLGFFYFLNISGNNHEIWMKLITVKDYTTKNILKKNWIFKIIFTIFTDPV
jgi:hypothetical protein